MQYLSLPTVHISPCKLSLIMETGQSESESDPVPNIQNKQQQQ